MCREEGQTLSHLAAQHPTLLGQFGLLGIVKEVAVDDAGLIDFWGTYFQYPLYMDPSQQFYQALGGRKITTLRTWNPLKLYRSFQEMKARIASKKGLEGNMVGEGLVQGGVIVLDRQGDVRAVYQELTGRELPVDDILEALTVLQAEAAANSEEA